MQAPETAGVEAPAASPSFEDTVLTLLTEMSGRLAATEAGVARQEERLDAIESQAASPRFVDPRAHVNADASDRSQEALRADPDGIPKSQTIPLFPSGERVPDLLMRQMRPKFRGGQWVQLNPDAVPYGRSDGRTRAELHADKGVPFGAGRVLDITYLSAHEGKGWKYRVKFDKTVMPGSNGGIVYLHEQEMLPA
jgi:hypothetical protein